MTDEHGPSGGILEGGEDVGLNRPGSLSGPAAARVLHLFIWCLCWTQQLLQVPELSERVCVRAWGGLMSPSLCGDTASSNPV